MAKSAFPPPPPTAVVPMEKLQSYSALAFLAFLGPHLANTVAGWFGEEAYRGVQVAARKFYHHPVGETLVLGSLGIHLVSSLYLAVQRYRNQRNAPQKPPSQRGSWISRRTIHSVAGFIVAFFVVGHVYGCRFDGPPPEFSGLWFLMNYEPSRVFFLPYLTLFGAAGAVHLVLGLPTALRCVNARRVAQFFAPKVVVSISIVGALFVVTGVLRIAGVIGNAGPYSGTPFIEHFLAHSPF